MKIFEAEDNNKEEEDLIEEEAKSYAIAVDKHGTFLEIAKVLRRHLLIVNHLTTL